MSSRLVLGNIFAWIRMSFLPSLSLSSHASWKLRTHLIIRCRNRGIGSVFLCWLCFSYWGSVFVLGSAVPTSFKYSPKDDLLEAKMKTSQVSFFPNVVRISQHFEKWNIQFPPSVFCRSQLCLIFVNHHIPPWQLSDGQRSLMVDPGVKALTGCLYRFLVHLTPWVSLSEVPSLLFQEVGFTSAGLRARWLCHEITKTWGPVFPPEDPLSLKLQPLLGLKVSRCSYSGPKTARDLKKQNCDVRYLSFLNVGEIIMKEVFFTKWSWSRNGIICTKTNWLVTKEIVSDLGEARGWIPWGQDPSTWLGSCVCPSTLMQQSVWLAV